MNPFSIARLPRIEFGDGVISKLGQICRSYGQRALLVTGAQSFEQSQAWQPLTQNLTEHGVHWAHCRIANEPSPQQIDEYVHHYANDQIEMVIGVGGGSALDAAKAIAGLLPSGDSVMDYLEGVGPERAYLGPALPWIAVPTTAGTGSEATKNAVLSLPGKQGFKKSFRDEKLVAEYAIVDPLLLANCPPALIAANGMDTLTQLMESYLSTRANPLTDALAISGLRAARDGLLPWYQNTGDVPHARRQMAFASLSSGITLAQTGLGSVHGLASPLGAFFPIPHGVVCGTLVASASKCNIQALHAREPANPALEKYATLGTVLCKQKFRDPNQARDHLLALLERWTMDMALPPLRNYQITPADFDRITQHSRGSSMRTNPIVLTDAEIKQVLQDRY